MHSFDVFSLTVRKHISLCAMKQKGLIVQYKQTISPGYDQSLPVRIFEHFATPEL